MTTRSTLWAVCAFALLGMSPAATADVVISQSNAPDEALRAEIGATLTVEHQALLDMRATQFQRLMAAPAEVPTEIEIFDRAYLREMPAASGGEQWRCLAEALYFEARGEKIEGIFAVGEVILNRVESSRYPDTVCGVIYQGTGQKFRCQFTYSCDGKKEVINEPRAHQKVGKIARLLLDDEVPVDLTDGATHYHTKSVNPRWAKVFPRTTTIGYHHFYREPRRVASN